jgi:hypothetical protein
MQQQYEGGLRGVPEFKCVTDARRADPVERAVLTAHQSIAAENVRHRKSLIEIIDRRPGSRHLQATLVSSLDSLLGPL